jgi:acyl carrier protein
MSVDDAVLGIVRGSLPEGTTIELHENFFAAGGTSLDALRFIVELEDRFDCSLPMMDILEAPTLEDVSACVEAAVRAGRAAGEAV